MTGSSIKKPWPTKTQTGLSRTHASSTRLSPAALSQSHSVHTVYRTIIPYRTVPKTPIVQYSAGSPIQPCGSSSQWAGCHPCCTRPNHCKRSARNITRADVNRPDENIAMPARDPTPGSNAQSKGASRSRSPQRLPVRNIANPAGQAPPPFCY